MLFQGLFHNIEHLCTNQYFVCHHVGAALRFLVLAAIGRYSHSLCISVAVVSYTSHSFSNCHIVRCSTKKLTFVTCVSLLDSVRAVVGNGSASGCLSVSPGSVTQFTCISKILSNSKSKTPLNPPQPSFCVITPQGPQKPAPLCSCPGCRSCLCCAPPKC